MRAHGDVVVVAPGQRVLRRRRVARRAAPASTPRSAAAKVDGIAEAWAVNGPPGLCVMFARLGVFGPVDLVVSGINPGANVGRAIYHSGTVGAALTARNGGISGVAVSQAVAGFGVEGQGWDEMIADQHWDTAAARRPATVVGAVLAAAARRARRRQRQRAEPAARRDRRLAPRRRSACCRRGPSPRGRLHPIAGQGGRLRRARWSGATRSSCRPTPTAAPSSATRSTISYLSRLVARGRDRPRRRRRRAGRPARRPASYTPDMTGSGTDRTAEWQALRDTLPRARGRAAGEHGPRRAPHGPHLAPTSSGRSTSTRGSSASR